MATLLDTVGNACEHHKSTQSWQEAIRSGCYICCRLKDLIPLSDIDECQSSVLKGDRDALFYCEINYPPEQPYNVRVTAKTYGINLAAWVIGMFSLPANISQSPGW
jgi:hypothetical protein